MQARWVQMIATLANVKATSFLKAYWTSRHGRIRASSLFDTFRTKYSDADKAVALSVDLLAASEQYAALDSPSDAVWAPYSKETRTLIASLKLIGSQQAHPVILSGLKRLPVAEMQKLLWLLEVTIVRFLLITGGNTGRFESACAKLAHSIFEGAVKTASTAFNELREVYPADAEFENSFTTKTERTNQKAQYFLRALEKEEQRLERNPIKLHHVRRRRFQDVGEGLQALREPAILVRSDTALVDRIDTPEPAASRAEPWEHWRAGGLIRLSGRNDSVG